MRARTRSHLQAPSRHPCPVAGRHLPPCRAPITALQGVWLHLNSPHTEWAERPKAAASPAPDHTGHLAGKSRCPWDSIKTQKAHHLRLSLQPGIGREATGRISFAKQCCRCLFLSGDRSPIAATGGLGAACTRGPLDRRRERRVKHPHTRNLVEPGPHPAQAHALPERTRS